MEKNFNQALWVCIRKWYKISIFASLSTIIYDSLGVVHSILHLPQLHPVGELHYTCFTPCSLFTKGFIASQIFESLYNCWYRIYQRPVHVQPNPAQTEEFLRSCKGLKNFHLWTWAMFLQADVNTPGISDKLRSMLDGLFNGTDSRSTYSQQQQQTVPPIVSPLVDWEAIIDAKIASLRSSVELQLNTQVDGISVCNVWYAIRIHTLIHTHNNEPDVSFCLGFVHNTRTYA